MFGDAPLRDGYIQIGSFKSDAPNWPHIYITVPVQWGETHSESLDDFIIEMSKGFLDAFNDGEIDTKQDRFRYYVMNSEDEYNHLVLGYFSDESSPTTFRTSDLLFDEEFSVFQEARNKIAEFYKDTLWFNPIVENYDNFSKIAQTVQEKFLQTERPDYSSVEIVNINSAFNNWSASITSYLNHLEKRLKNRDSEVYWSKFHSHTSEQYDQNASYRFIYGLRNYIQHQAPPIHINYNAALENEQPIYQVEIFCSKEELLKGKKWNKRQREDILKMDDMIDISLHVDNMMQSLNQILVMHFQDEFLYLHQSAMYIHDLIQKIPQGNDRGVYEIRFSNKQMVGMTAHLMYPKIVKAIVEGDVYQILKVS